MLAKRVNFMIVVEEAYAVMSRVAFSPTRIWGTPSSQPGGGRVRIAVSLEEEGKLGVRLGTSDDSTNANSSNEVAAADGSVEPGRSVNQSVRRGPVGRAREKRHEGSLLLAPIAIGVLEETSVLHNDLLADLRVGAVALLANSLDDTHDD